VYVTEELYKKYADITQRSSYNWQLQGFTATNAI